MCEFNETKIQEWSNKCSYKNFTEVESPIYAYKQFLVEQYT